MLRSGAVRRLSAENLRRSFVKLAALSGTKLEPLGRIQISESERNQGRLDEKSVAAAIASLEVNGVCCFESALEEKWVNEAHSRASTAFDNCLERFPGGLQVGMDHGFAEVVHRAAGRYDVLDGVNGSFLDGVGLVTPLIERLLGRGSRRLFNGLLMTKPGSAEQLWHADGEHLFSTTHSGGPHRGADGSFSTLPAHALNVFIPLVDLTAENGVTEFCLGSHYATNISPEIVWQVCLFKLDRSLFKVSLTTRPRPLVW